MPSVFEYKFVLPPSIALFLLYLADSNVILDLLNEDSLNAFFLGAVGLLALGFSISAPTYLFINLVFLNKLDEAEGWRNLQRRGKFVQSQVSKRWDFLIANINATFAILLTWLIVFVEDAYVESSWILGTIVLFVCFIGNAIWVYRSYIKIRNKLGLYSKKTPSV